MGEVHLAAGAPGRLGSRLRLWAGKHLGPQEGWQKPPHPHPTPRRLPFPAASEPSQQLPRDQSWWVIPWSLPSGKRPGEGGLAPQCWQRTWASWDHPALHHGSPATSLRTGRDGDPPRLRRAEGGGVRLERSRCPGNSCRRQNPATAPQGPPLPTPCQAAARVFAKRLSHPSSWTRASSSKPWVGTWGESVAEPEQDPGSPRKPAVQDLTWSRTTRSSGPLTAPSLPVGSPGLLLV